MRLFELKGKIEEELSKIRDEQTKNISTVDLGWYFVNSPLSPDFEMWYLPRDKSVRDKIFALWKEYLDNLKF